MSENKHTPGPWVWRGKDGGLYQEGTAHRFGDAVLVASYEYDSGIDTVVSEEDAALIAAAPDLLEALIYVETRCVSDAAYKYASIEERKMRDMVVAAIAKAEGRS